MHEGFGAIGVDLFDVGGQWIVEIAQVHQESAEGVSHEGGGVKFCAIDILDKGEESFPGHDEDRRILVFVHPVLDEGFLREGVAGAV